MNSKYCRPLLIWDIDGTLLEPRGVGRLALNQAFAELSGMEQAFDHMDFAGATDHDLLVQATRDFTGDIKPDVFFSLYLYHLDRVLDSSPLKPLPGVIELILRLSQAGWPMTLGTGNIRHGAYLKLNKAGISHYFPGGGFSLPTITRAHILRMAHASVDESRPAIVIGDTRRDIQAAHQTGLPIIAVATGRFTREDLKRAGADQILDNLQNFDHFLTAMRNIGAT